MFPVVAGVSLDRFIQDVYEYKLKNLEEYENHLRKHRNVISKISNKGNSINNYQTFPTREEEIFTVLLFKYANKLEELITNQNEELGYKRLINIGKEWESTAFAEYIEKLIGEPNADKKDYDINLIEPEDNSLLTTTKIFNVTVTRKLGTLVETILREYENQISSFNIEKVIQDIDFIKNREDNSLNAIAWAVSFLDKISVQGQVELEIKLSFFAHLVSNFQAYQKEYNSLDFSTELDYRKTIPQNMETELKSILGRYFHGKYSALDIRSQEYLENKLLYDAHSLYYQINDILNMQTEPQEHLLTELTYIDFIRNYSPNKRYYINEINEASNG
jgi:hypothetical protein